MGIVIYDHHFFIILLFSSSIKNANILIHLFSSFWVMEWTKEKVRSEDVKISSNNLILIDSQRRVPMCNNLSPFYLTFVIKGRPWMTSRIFWYFWTPLPSLSYIYALRLRTLEQFFFGVMMAKHPRLTFNDMWKGYLKVNISIHFSDFQKMEKPFEVSFL